MNSYSENNHRTETGRVVIRHEKENERQILGWLHAKSKSWSMESSTEIENIFMAAVSAGKKKLPIHLLIFVIRDKEYTKKNKKRHVYICDPVGITAEEINADDDTEINAALERYNVLMDSLIARNLSKEYATESGRTLFQKLIPEKIRKRLESELEKSNIIEWGVWIYSDDDDFNPLWEWLYTSPKVSNSIITETSSVEHQKTTNKNSSSFNFLHLGRWQNREKKTKESKVPPLQKNQKEEGFFWGDKYHIIRIPENCEFENSKFQINTFTFLLDGSCLPACEKCKKSKKYLKELLEEEDIVKCNEIKFYSPEKFDDLEVLDCIHVGVCEETFKKNPIEYNTKFLEKLRQKPNFLFLNMFAEESSSTYAPLSEAIKSVPPNTWIDSSRLNVPTKFALDFIECFYEMFKESLKNNNEVKIVEIIQKTREKIEKNQEKSDSNAFWRLAYVVNGNPHTKFTKG